MAVSPLASQSKESPVSLQAKVSPASVTTGSSIELQVSFTNLSNRRIYLTLIQGFAAEYNVFIQVHSLNGKSPEKTEYFDTILNPASHPGKLATRSAGLRSIEPGETLTFECDLAKLFTLTPDRYEISVGKGEPNNDKAIVWSKPVTLDVVAR